MSLKQTSVASLVLHRDKQQCALVFLDARQGWACGLRPLSSGFVAGTDTSVSIQGSRFEVVHLNCVN